MRIRECSSDVCSADLSFSWSSERCKVSIRFIGQPSFEQIRQREGPAKRLGGDRHAVQRVRKAVQLAGAGDVRLYMDPGGLQGLDELADGRLPANGGLNHVGRSEEHTSELQSLMRISYAVFCLKKKTLHNTTHYT